MATGAIGLLLTLLAHVRWFSFLTARQYGTIDGKRHVVGHVSVIPTWFGPVIIFLAVFVAQFRVWKAERGRANGLHDLLDSTTTELQSVKTELATEKARPRKGGVNAIAFGDNTTLLNSKFDNISVHTTEANVVTPEEVEHVFPEPNDAWMGYAQGRELHGSAVGGEVSGRE